jgi:hypothetical protein
MRHSFACALGAAAILGMMTVNASAQFDTLVYSFEGGTVFAPDGFAPNGGGTITKTPGTGATVGANSMNYSILAGDTFVGALTQNPLPAILTDPNTTAIKMDVTLTEPYAGSNAQVLITYFAYHDPDDIPGTGDETAFGTPFQTNAASAQQLAGLPAGTHTLSVNLLEHFSGQPFNGPTLFNHPDPAMDWDIGGFQITFSKDNTAPLNVYIDNVRTVTVPEPGTALLVACGAVAGLRMRRSRR